MQAASCTLHHISKIFPYWIVSLPWPSSKVCWSMTLTLTRTLNMITWLQSSSSPLYLHHSTGMPFSYHGSLYCKLELRLLITSCTSSKPYGWACTHPWHLRVWERLPPWTKVATPNMADGYSATDELVISVVMFIYSLSGTSSTQSCWSHYFYPEISYQQQQHWAASTILLLLIR